MATTADLTLRVNNHDVSTISVTRGETQDFQFGYDGEGGFPEGLIFNGFPSGGFGYSSDSAYTISLEPDGEALYLAGEGDEGYGLVGLGSAMGTNSDGQTVIYDLSGKIDGHYDANPGSHDLNFNIYTIDTQTGALDLQSIEVPAVHLFGQSAGSSLEVGQNGQKIIVDDDGAFLSVGNNAEGYSTFFRVEADVEGQYSIVENKSFEISHNVLPSYHSPQTVNSDGSGLYFKDSSDDLYYVDAAAAASQFVDGIPGIPADHNPAVSKVFDASNGGAYDVASLNYWGVGEFPVIVMSEKVLNPGVSDSISLFSGNVTSIVQTGSSGTATYSSEHGAMSPIVTISEDDIGAELSSSGYGENWNFFSPSSWGWGGLEHNILTLEGEYGTPSYQNYVIVTNAFSATPSDSVNYIIDAVSLANETGSYSSNFGPWGYSSTLNENGLVLSSGYQNEAQTYYVLEFDESDSGTVIIDSVSDFDRVITERDQSNYDSRDDIIFTDDLNPIYQNSFQGGGVSLALEMTAGETYQTLQDSGIYTDSHYQYVGDLSQYDFDDDGFVNFSITAHSSGADDLLPATSHSISMGSNWSGFHEFGTLQISSATSEDGQSQELNSIPVTVINDGTGNKYELDGVQQDTLNLVEGKTYVFDWSGASAHPLRFSDVSDGTHDAGAEYTDGVVVDSAAFRTTITVAEGAPDLNYYCEFHPGMGGSVVTQSLNLAEMLIDDAIVDGADHVVDPSESISVGGSAGDYAYVDRSYGGAVVYDADGTTSGIDFVGNENTFILDASSEFDFFGYSYDPMYTDDSELVVLTGGVGAGTRTIEFGESTGGVEDWDVVSFDGLDTSVILDLSAVDANYDATATSMGQVVAYVDGAEGIFGTAHGDVLSGDSGRNILHGGQGDDVVSGGEGQDLVSGGAGADNVYGGAGEDILIDIEGGDSIFGDGTGEGTLRADDTFVVGQGTKVMDFDLSPDGTGLSGRSNQANDIVFVQVAAASLAAAGYGLQQIYELVSGTNDAAWRSFVRDLEVEVVASDTTGSQPYNEIRLSIDGNNDGQASDLGAISFLEAGTGSGNYNAVKMKSQLEGIMAQFESSASDNAHVLEQFFGMDTLTASQVAALERAAEAGEDAEAAGGDVTAVKDAIEAELAGETFEAAQAVRDALTAQVNVSGATPSDVVAAAEAVIDDVVDEALAATDMDTSLFVPVAVEEIREGTVRTEVVEDRDAALAAIEQARQDALDSGATQAQADEAADQKREEELQVTTIVDREPESGSSSEPAPEAIVVLSNADDVVVSTSGADDRFEVVPQVFVDQTDTALSNQDAGKDVIVDLDSRDSSGAGGGGSSGDQTAQVDLDALGDVVYLEGVNGIGDVNFERQQIGREGQNSLKITTTVKGEDGNGTVVASNASEVNIFKQFDALTDRFAIETLEISDTQGNSEYWSLSTAEAQRGDGRILDTYITTDVSNTGKGILIGSDTASDKYVVNADADDSAEIMVVGFDVNDSIDLTAFGNDLSTTVNGSDVEVSNGNGDIVVTLIGLGAQTSIDEQLIGVQQV